jgi:phage terminase small subunit
VKHERFVQLLLQGESITDAHERAGFARSDANSSRLKSHPKVAERLAELQGEIAGENKITVASLLDELEDARKRADSLDMLSAVVKAISEKAKIAGLMAPQKLEIGAPGSFEKCETPEQVVDELLTYELHPCIEVHERDRRTLVEMYLKHFAEVEEFIAGLKARPVNVVSPYSQRHIELQRSGNGKSRS